MDFPPNTHEIIPDTKIYYPGGWGREGRCQKGVGEGEGEGKQREHMLQTGGKCIVNTILQDFKYSKSCNIVNLKWSAHIYGQYVSLYFANICRSFNQIKHWYLCKSCKVNTVTEKHYCT